MFTRFILLRILMVSFALFSMFFGSGNIIFPIILGLQIQNSFLSVALGWCLGSVALPMIAVFALIRFNGNAIKYWAYLGKVPTYCILLFLLALVGPFGVIPRCVTVSFGATHLAWPSLSFLLFCFFFCFIKFLMVVRSEKLASFLAHGVGPMKLSGVLLMLLTGTISVFLYPNLHSVPTYNTFNDLNISDFWRGFSTAYQTMDLVGVYFFSEVAYLFLRSELFKLGCTDLKQLRIYMVYSLFVTGLILAVVYTGLLYLSFTHAEQLLGTESSLLLARLNVILFGDIGAWLTAFVISVSCLSTAAVLLFSWSTFLHEEILKNMFSIHYPFAYLIILTLSSIISFLISLLGFSQIMLLLGNLLQYLYPLLILEVLFSFFRSANNKEMGTVV